MGIFFFTFSIAAWQSENDDSEVDCTFQINFISLTLLPWAYVSRAVGIGRPLIFRVWYFSLTYYSEKIVRQKQTPFQENLSENCTICSVFTGSGNERWSEI